MVNYPELIGFFICTFQFEFNKLTNIKAVDRFPFQSLNLAAHQDWQSENREMLIPP